MEESKKRLPTPVLVLIVIALETLVSLLPGIILMEDGVKLSVGLSLFILYLFISNFFQMNLRLGHSLSLRLYMLKIGLSLGLIWLVASKLSYQHGIILLAYEVFQFLNFSLIYDYFQRLSYTLVNAFFKGIVFNLIISLNSATSFQLIYLQPYLFSFLLFLALTLLAQARYGLASRKPQQLILAGLSSLSMYVLLFWQYQHQQVTLAQFLIVLVLSLAAFSYYIWETDPRKTSLSINLAALLLLFVYYFF